MLLVEAVVDISLDKEFLEVEVEMEGLLQEFREEMEQEQGAGEELELMILKQSEFCLMEVNLSMEVLEEPLGVRGKMEVQALVLSS